jgi:hypothetical protein
VRVFTERRKVKRGSSKYIYMQFNSVGSADVNLRSARVTFVNGAAATREQSIIEETKNLTLFLKSMAITPVGGGQRG